MECVLGVDVGTSRVKVVLADRAGQKVVEERSAALEEWIDCEVPAGRERDVSHVLSVLGQCLKEVDPSLLGCVRAVGVCGQMHGCVVWSSDGSRPPSNLVTWQDGRCDEAFLSSLPPTGQSVCVSSGYGCATLAWLQRHRPEELVGRDRAGTIMDYIVWRMVGGEGPVTMSSQNAVSWGFFDPHTLSWERESLAGSGFPLYLLPDVVAAPARAGYLSEPWCGVPRGVAVGVAMGDLQCSIMAAQPTLSDVVLNIGTASQLAAVVSATPPHLPPSVLPLPYFTDQWLLVAASLTGGNAVSTMATALTSWMRELGVAPPTQEEMYSHLMKTAEGKLDTSLRVGVRLWGERHAPLESGGVANITPDNISLGDIGSAVFRGIVENLLSMFSADLLQQLKVQRVVGSGTALLRNTVLQRHTERLLGVPLMMREGADAPLGAAMAVEALAAADTL